MKSGHSLLKLTLPALVNGKISQLNLSSFHDQWTVFCLPARLSLVEALFLEQQSLKFTREGAELVGLVLNSHPFPLPWIGAVAKLRYPLLADPLGKIGKIFRISEPDNPAKSQSLIFDNKSFLRCHLIHEFNGRGMAYVVEMLRHYQNQSGFLGHPLDRGEASNDKLPPIPFHNQKKFRSRQLGGRKHDKRRQSRKETTHQIAGL